MASEAPAARFNAWPLGVQQHLESLSPTQRAACKAPINTNTCLNIIIRAQGRERGSSQLVEFTRPPIDPPKTCSRCICAKSCAFVSPIWGPIRMALTLISDHEKTIESLSMLLHRVVSSIEEYAAGYEDLFTVNSSVQKILGPLQRSHRLLHKESYASIFQISSVPCTRLLIKSCLKFLSISTSIVLKLLKLTG